MIFFCSGEKKYERSSVKKKNWLYSYVRRFLSVERLEAMSSVFSCWISPLGVSDDSSYEFLAY